MRSEIEKAKGFGLAPGEVQAMLAASGGGGGAQPVPPPSNLNARLERGGGRLHAHLHHVDHVRHGRVGRHIDVDLNVPGRGEVGVVVQVLRKRPIKALMKREGTPLAMPSNYRTNRM